MSRNLITAVALAIGTLLSGCARESATDGAEAAPNVDTTTVSGVDANGHPLIPVSRIAHQKIDECSGIVHHGGAFWVHNDSGDGPILYRSIDLDFLDVEILPVPGADAEDWEDITVYKGDLLVCDMGDNRRKRAQVQLYRCRYVAGPAGGRIELIATYPVVYPDGAHDAEACFTIDDRIFITTKDRGDGTLVFALDDPVDRGQLKDGGANLATRIAELDVGQEMVTAGTYDPSTETVVLLTYSGILRYPKDRLMGAPAMQSRIWARQAEGICFHDGRVIFTNEEKDVFAIDDFMGESRTEILPPRGSGTLPVAADETVPADDLGSTGTELSLQNSRPDEFLRWLLHRDRLHLHGVFQVDHDPTPTEMEADRLGTAVIFSFARDGEQAVSSEDRTFALGIDARSRLAVWRLGETGEVIERLDHETARIRGLLERGRLAFSLSIPIETIFSGPAPDRFFFDAHGVGLHRDGDFYFSGQGTYAIYRPYVWGEIVVVR